MSGSAESTEHFEESAQRRVLDAIDARQLADFTSLPEPQRRLSADFLQRLISGSLEARRELCCPLRIRGADIVGLLRPPPAGQGGGRTAVQFWECKFDSPVDFSGAEFLVLRFVDCRLPAFIGASLSVSAGLDLSGSQFSGVDDYESELSLVGSCAIHLGNARIGGRLDMSSTNKSRFSAAGVVRLDGARIDGDVSLAGALLDGRGAEAVSARSIIVGSNVNLRPASGHRFEAIGEIGFSAAQITGDLMCEGARLSNPEGRALHCEDLKVESVFLTSDDRAKLPFEAQGRLNFLTAVIGGSFFLTQARLAPGPDYGGLLRTGGPVAINLQQARISNALAVSNVGALSDESESRSLREAPVPVAGWFLLTGAQVNSVLDSIETGWPAPGFLDLDGLVYERIRHVGRGNLAAKRIKWLRLQFPEEVPSAATFRPQPYEQLSRVLRQHGLAREANAIAVEKIRVRLESRVDGPWARIFPSLLMLISHHGYSSSRAVLSFLIFVLLGTVMYAVALFGFGQPFLPVESDPQPVVYEFALGTMRATSEQGCPGLHVMHYALDAALPVIDVGQDLRCRFTPEGPLRWFWLLLNSLYIITGAALSAVVVLTLTGVLRQD
jgi:hypothetical protein